MLLQRRGTEHQNEAGMGEVRPSRGRPIDLVHLARQTLGDRGLEREVLGLMSRQIAQCSLQFELVGDSERSAIAHAIRGAADNVGAFALAAAARHVEDRPAHPDIRKAMLAEMRRTDDFIRTLLG